MSDYLPTVEIVETFYEYRGLTGLTQADFTITIFNSGVISSVLPVLTEIGFGWYSVAFTPNVVGDWQIDVFITADDYVRYQKGFAVRDADVVNVDPIQVATAVWDATIGDGSAREYLDKTKKYVSNRLDLNGQTYTVKEDDGITDFETGTITNKSRRPN